MSQGPLPSLAIVAAVPAAMASAAAFGLTSALQHRATQLVRQRAALQPSLLLDLAHQPLWRLSLITTFFGVVLQWVALATGPLVLVQPLLVSGVLFAVAFAALMRRQRPDRIVLFGASLCALGLTGFMLIGRPSNNTDDSAPDMTLGDALPLAITLVVLVAGCVVVAARAEGVTRTLALAVGAGLLYGATAGLIKVVIGTLEQSPLAMLTSWPIYAVAVCGPLGFLLSQNAFQAGVALAPALAIITVLDPLVGIGIGLLWLGESLTGGGLAIVGEVAALVLVVIGVVVLSHRAPQVAMQADQHQRR